MNAFVKWLASPLSEWHLVTLQHKLFVGGAGAATFWYLHKTYPKWPWWKIAGIALGAAYGTSAVLNAARRFQAPAAVPATALPQAPPSPPQPPPPVPQGQVFQPQVDQSMPPMDTKEVVDGLSGDDEPCDGIFS